MNSNWIGRCHFYWFPFSSQRLIKIQMQVFKLPLLSQRKNLILLKRAHGRWEGVNSNQAITRVQRAGCFPNKTKQVTSFQVMRIPTHTSQEQQLLQWSSSAQNVLFYWRKYLPWSLPNKSAEASLGPASPEPLFGEGENSSNNSRCQKWTHIQQKTLFFLPIRCALKS